MGSKAHRGSESAKVVVLQRLWRLKEGAPMPTECSSEYFDFGTVEGRAVEAAFDGGLVTSDAGALLLGATDRAIGMIDRFARCFHDVRQGELDRAQRGDAGGPAGVCDRSRLRGSQRSR